MAQSPKLSGADVTVFDSTVQQLSFNAHHGCGITGTVKEIFPNCLTHLPDHVKLHATVQLVEANTGKFGKLPYLVFKSNNDPARCLPPADAPFSGESMKTLFNLGRDGKYEQMGDSHNNTGMILAAHAFREDCVMAFICYVHAEKRGAIVVYAPDPEAADGLRSAVYAKHVRRATGFVVSDGLTSVKFHTGRTMSEDMQLMLESSPWVVEDIGGISHEQSRNKLAHFILNEVVPIGRGDGLSEDAKSGCAVVQLTSATDHYKQTEDGDIVRYLDLNNKAEMVSLASLTQTFLGGADVSSTKHPHIKRFQPHNAALKTRSLADQHLHIITHTGRVNMLDDALMINYTEFSMDVQKVSQLGCTIRMCAEQRAVFSGAEEKAITTYNLRMPCMQGEDKRAFWTAEGEEGPHTDLRFLAYNRQVTAQNVKEQFPIVVLRANDKPLPKATLMLHLQRNNYPMDFYGNNEAHTYGATLVKMLMETGYHPERDAKFYKEELGFEAMKLIEFLTGPWWKGKLHLYELALSTTMDVQVGNLALEVGKEDFQNEAAQKYVRQGAMQVRFMHMAKHASWAADFKKYQSDPARKEEVQQWVRNQNAKNKVPPTQKPKPPPKKNKKPKKRSKKRAREGEESDEEIQEVAEMSDNESEEEEEEHEGEEDTYDNNKARNERADVFCALVRAECCDIGNSAHWPQALRNVAKELTTKPDFYMRVRPPTRTIMGYGDRRTPREFSLVARSMIIRRMIQDKNDEEEFGGEEQPISEMFGDPDSMMLVIEFQQQAASAATGDITDSNKNAHSGIKWDKYKKKLYKNQKRAKKRREESAEDDAGGEGAPPVAAAAHYPPAGQPGPSAGLAVQEFDEESD